MTADIPQKVRAFFTTYPAHSYPKGHLLVQAGTAPAGVFYLAEGQVHQYDIAASGNQVIVNSFKPGAFFPMSWAINNTPNDYFFETSSTTTTHVVPQQDAVAFLQANPDVTFDLLSRVYRGTDGVLRRLAHLMGGSAHSRLLFELINAAHRFGTASTDGITLPITETELAKRSGLARETISRTLAGLKDKGLVIVVNRKLVVPNLPLLEQALSDDL